MKVVRTKDKNKLLMKDPQVKIYLLRAPKKLWRLKENLNTILNSLRIKVGNRTKMVKI